MKRSDRWVSTALVALLVSVLACNAPVALGPTEPDVPEITEPGEPTATAPAADATPPPPSGPRTSPPEALIQPADLAYLGAFRLPDWPDDEVGWMWSGAALAYYPGGDPGGPDDGFPGSLLGTGHDFNQYVSEISIPEPLISAGKDVEALNTAETLQPFQPIWGDLYEGAYMEIPRTGLAYLPPQGDQGSGKLYFCRAPHLDEGATNPSHGWAELDLSDPQPAGLWRIGVYENYVTTDYLFPIPQSWADAHTPGMLLATGRYRDGGQAAQGPALFAVGPWNEGNPPAPGSTLEAVPLLLYGSLYEDGAPTMDGYAHSDHWTGGAWLTAGDRSAVIFVGTKGLGETWYGCADGTVWPEDPPYPPECPERGWWSERFAGQVLFYDPAELAAVAAGALEPWAPQPYAVMDIDDVLYKDFFALLNDIGAVAFDRERGLLYVMEPLADEGKSLVHVWRVGE